MTDVTNLLNLSKKNWIYKMKNNKNFLKYFWDFEIFEIVEIKVNFAEKRTLSEFQYIEIIAMVPSSVTNREKTIREQDEDKNILWLKNLILINWEDRPNVKEFENPEQRIWFKQFNSMRIIDGILYRNSDHSFGMKRVQLALPEKSVNSVLDKIHRFIYSSHLGRRKTYRIMSKRFYRPFLGKQVEKYIQACEVSFI